MPWRRYIASALLLSAFGCSTLSNRDSPPPPRPTYDQYRFKPEFREGLAFDHPFVRDCIKEAELLPDAAQQTLADAGLHIAFYATLLTNQPEMSHRRGQPVGGRWIQIRPTTVFGHPGITWESTGTWDVVRLCYTPPKNTILLGTGTSTNIQHEIGHAIDEWGERTTGTRFSMTAAYRALFETYLDTSPDKLKINTTQDKAPFLAEQFADDFSDIMLRPEDFSNEKPDVHGYLAGVLERLQNAPRALPEDDLEIIVETPAIGD